MSRRSQEGAELPLKGVSQVLKRLTALLTLLFLLPACTAARPPQIDFLKTEELPAPARPTASIRVGAATILSLREGFLAYRAVADHIGAVLATPADLVMRKSYQELNELVRSGAVDLAVVGYGGYLAGRRQFGMEALALAEVDGTVEGDALILVRSESGLQRLSDLAGKGFAFTDPASVTGHLALRAELESKGQTPERFFSKLVYTFSHSGSIEALIGRVVDGALVNSHHFRTYLASHPALAGRMTVIGRIHVPGSMVIAVRPDLPAARKRELQQILTSMHESPAGRKALGGLLIERLVRPPEGGIPPAR